MHPLAVMVTQVHFFDHTQVAEDREGGEVQLDGVDLDPNPYLLMMPAHTRGKVRVRTIRCCYH